MAGLKRFEKENGLPGWQGLVWAGGCAALALAARTDYNAIGVLIICALYLDPRRPQAAVPCGRTCCLCSSSPPRWRFVLVWFYNGQRGACSPLQKKAFYWFYPVHLLVLAGITNLLL
ncbi:MAG: TraX family protein [Faecalibacterium prausnitzii]